MSRTYINGVGRVSFNGTFLSFVLDDTFQEKSGATNQTAVIELITELEAAEGICRYLLEEISKIKKIKNTPVKNDNIDSNIADDSTVSDDRPPIGTKILMSKHDHSN
jgi:hypothetical protein